MISSTVQRAQAAPGLLVTVNRPRRILSRWFLTALLGLVVTAVPGMTGCGSSDQGSEESVADSSGSRRILPDSPLDDAPDSPIGVSQEGQSSSEENPIHRADLNSGNAGSPRKGATEGPQQSFWPSRQADTSSQTRVPETQSGKDRNDQIVDLIEGIDDSQLASLGIQKIGGNGLTIYTDVRGSSDIQSFPEVFAKAVPQWSEYFRISPEKVASWKLTAFVILNKDVFAKAGLLNDRLPSFAAGYQHGNQIWLYYQKGPYYTRHLLLHEATHAFMQRFLGGYGPPWYSEGMAELLAVHRWSTGSLKMTYRLRDRTEAENWGRVRIIQDAVKSNRSRTLKEVLQYRPNVFFNVAEPYAWSWAACKLLAQHPLSRQKFSSCSNQAHLPGEQFNQRLLAELADQWPQLEVAWQLMIEEMEYGYDVAAAAVSDVTTVAGKTSKIDVSRGWQRTGIQAEPGKRYVIRGTGQFQVRIDSEPWISEPPGVSLEYYRGRYLGELQVAVDALDHDGKSTLLQARPAAGRTVRFAQTGRICFRINESPSQLDDNQGQITVEVQEIEGN